MNLPSYTDNILECVITELAVAFFFRYNVIKISLCTSYMSHCQVL